MWNYVKKMLSSSQLVSFSRNGSLLALVIMLALDVFKVVCGLHLSGGPVLPTQNELIGQGILISSLYGPGKLGETIQRFAPGSTSPDSVVNVDIKQETNQQ